MSWDDDIRSEIEDMFSDLSVPDTGMPWSTEPGSVPVHDDDTAVRWIQKEVRRKRRMRCPEYRARRLASQRDSKRRSQG